MDTLKWMATHCRLERLYVLRKRLYHNLRHLP